MKKHHLHYTLIEVLVAVAVLALMMSFLFQFTAGAQRIWSASNANTGITANADVLFALLDEDLMQMLVDDEEGMSYTGSVSGDGTDADFGFFAISGRKGGVKAGGGDSANEVGSLIYVQYHYDSGEKCLYRVQKSAADNSIYSDSDNTAPLGNVTTFDTDDYTDATLVAEGVEKFMVTAKPNNGNTLPQILRVQVTLNRTTVSEDRKSDKEAKFEQVFSKVYFPGMR